MRKSIVVFAILALFIFSLVPASAAGGIRTVRPGAAKSVKSAVCPVMGKAIPDVSKAAAKSTYKGKTYYFCCGSCKHEFDKNPAKYIKAPAKK